GAPRLLVVAEDQEVADGQLVEGAGDARVEADAVEGVAHDQPGPGLGVVERLDPGVVAGAEGPAGPALADGDDVDPPGVVGGATGRGPGGPGGPRGGRGPGGGRRAGGRVSGGGGAGRRR